MAATQGSATVRVQYPPGEVPQRVDAAAAELAEFGDIARIDMSLAFSTGAVLVTYFDVRCAQRVLTEFAGMADSFPAAPHDFRLVRVSTNDFMNIAGSGLGEVAGVQIVGADMLIEFFDLRSAQRAAEVVSAGSANMVDHLMAAQQAAPQMCPQMPSPVAQAMAELQVQQVMLSQMNAQQKSQMTAHQPMLNQTFGLDAMSNEVAEKRMTKKVNAETSTAAQKKAATPSKPVREKVKGKDLQKFEIDVHAIESGEDKRTTVMLRNMPKACSREDFLRLLEHCSLRDRITFLYMPFDKRRNVHCGFAFVNFASPEDVLTMAWSMSGDLWKGLANSTSMPPAMSYARLQGHDQLVGHFSLSAVMYDDDARKRPLFVARNGGVEEPRKGKQGPKDVQKAFVDSPNVMPAYVTPAAGSRGRLGSEEIAWLRTPGSELQDGPAAGA